MNPPPLTRRDGLLIISFWLCLWAIRFFAPADWCDLNQQERQAAYVLDLLVNGEWICQENCQGILAGKPPLYTWLSALASLIFCGGQLTWFSLTLPASVAVLGTALLIWRWLGSEVSPRAGWLGAMIFLCLPMSSKMILLGRIDPLLCFFVFACFVTIHRALFRGGSWIIFWATATLGFFAKGPICLALGGCCVISWFWEKRHHAAECPPAPAWIPQVAGLCGVFALAGLWFLVAREHIGPAFTQRVIEGELKGHFLGGADDVYTWDELLWNKTKPCFFILSRSAPWSLMALWMLYRHFKFPSIESRRRQASSALAAAWIGGTLVFTLAMHRRPDIIYPVMPFVAAFAGIALDDLLKGSWRRLDRTAAALILSFLVLAGVAVERWIIRPAGSKDVRRTSAIEGLAKHLRQQFPDGLPEWRQSWNTPFGLQICFNTHTQHLPSARLADFLKAHPSGLAMVHENDEASFLDAAGRLGLELEKISFSTSNPSLKGESLKIYRIAAKKP
ncbi:MAG: hypothetical protein RL095_4007 [Verrucomicrobiota bacterium]